MIRTIKNNRNGLSGLIVKETNKCYKVAYLHPTIKNAHQYAYWKKGDCSVKEYCL